MKVRKKIHDDWETPDSILYMIREEFGDYVIDYFTDEYMNGRTPNPCVLCNTHIKWEALLKRADMLKCKYIATGHYAQTNNSKLLKAFDANKDQTYFLHAIDKHVLSKTLFPYLYIGL